MSTNYEPSAERVEALAKELHGAGRPAYGDWLLFPSMSEDWKAMMRAEARFVLRRQHEREEPLLKELRDQLATWRQETPTRTKLERVLAAHAKLDAPKVPTLLELHAAFERHESPDTVRPLLAALVKAAIERGERGA